ncbi:hypothetical protein LSA36186_14130 [Lachnoanaerobaculum sp. JCM 36186]|jgi:hypothetical protein|uniref:ATP-dependent nuclease n=1 Tax=Lachnoanaerobaculum sanguinis TaxID=3065809 RepID=UPI002762D1E8|nr:AAA family ATPase [Lachnoanaerobaculum sp. JCM 36186]GMO03164.1 hypothetical protein LSA36186_14130 [Lachnoanaerobaculum sp. JCM 36186]
MIKIEKIKIERFRSINCIEMSIDQENNLIAICGKNNVGKTNALRAINIFFNPGQYDKAIDMTTLKQATGGGTTHPKISITFYDDKSEFYFEIVRDINLYENGKESFSGKKYQKGGAGKRKINPTVLTDDEIKVIINKFEFVYVESINVILPEIISDITEDVITAEYDKAKFSSNKKQLKESYDSYIDGLTEILGAFANDISGTFREFQPAWSVRFDVPKNSDSFRELISNDVSLQLDDSGSIGIEDKGAGLQRLAAILLQFELLMRRRKKNKINIVCIDEPDAYIHEGLQRKLKDFLEDRTNNSQILLTTHSKVFLNQYSMKNVFLFDAKYRMQYSARRKRDINVVETYLVDINTEDGHKKICEHLGIETITCDPLKKHNLIVEGGCDEKYISELGKFFGLKLPYIISANGADNIFKYLEFYDSYYKDLEERPYVKVLLDNDEKGREVFNNIKESKYRNIQVEKIMLKNFRGTEFVNDKKYLNNEIEDLMYPEIMIDLINVILTRKNLNRIRQEEACNKIKAPAFEKKGVLYLCENEKNEENLEKGTEITLYPSSDAGIKKSIAEQFNLEVNLRLIEKVVECDRAYPAVREFITGLLDYQESI